MRPTAVLAIGSLRSTRLVVHPIGTAEPSFWPSDRACCNSKSNVFAYRPRIYLAEQITCVSLSPSLRSPLCSASLRTQQTRSSVLRSSAIARALLHFAFTPATLSLFGEARAPQRKAAVTRAYPRPPRFSSVLIPTLLTDLRALQARLRSHRSFDRFPAPALPRGGCGPFPVR
jgi:hypothetical protein